VILPLVERARFPFFSQVQIIRQSPVRMIVAPLCNKQPKTYQHHRWMSESKKIDNIVPNQLPSSEILSLVFSQ
jgi:hypothetical protein